MHLFVSFRSWSITSYKPIAHFEYDKAIDGVRQILWGLFKKVVIADMLIFSNYQATMESRYC